MRRDAAARRRRAEVSRKIFLRLPALRQDHPVGLDWVRSEDVLEVARARPTKFSSIPPAERGTARAAPRQLGPSLARLPSLLPILFNIA